MSSSKPTKSTEIRKTFLDYFAGRGHRVVKSSSLIPVNDPTLLFTNAGMVQFKDIFTGDEKRDYTRAATSQKCVRAGGKHNDLENVGRTARHHTFFEMLGNFSFGDYFKEDAIAYAYELLTRDIGLDVGRMHITVFKGEDGIPRDDEAAGIWKKMGIPESRIRYEGKKDNFWQMGDTGPCGPCSEIHFDRGVVKGAFGGDDPEGDRILEIWNLVFMQYQRFADGTMKPLPKPSIDTGGGLERWAMVLGGYASNYDSDLFKPLIDATCEEVKKKYSSSDSLDDVAMRVIADHSRACSFLMADGVMPSNEGRGYVLRRIMRRAIKFGDQLGYKDVFFDRACGRVVDLMKDIYPELQENRSLILKTAQQEEEAFRRTLSKGLKLIDEFSAWKQEGNQKIMPGDAAWNLYATYGFPVDLTQVIGRDKGFVVDEKGFEKAKEEHEKVSAAGGLGLEGIAEVYKGLRNKHGATKFLGYETTEAQGTVKALLVGGKDVESVSSGKVELVMDQTPFYGEAGGQVGDTGEITAGGVKLQVTDTRKYSDVIVHHAEVKQGSVKVGDKLTLKVDADRRDNVRAHHSATHLLHAALKKVLGDHVKQAGSLVAPDRLRFDYSHFQPVTDEQMAAIEDLVNRWVLQNAEAQTEVTSFDAARAKGAVALFGEKYGDEVRMLRLGENSVELCGGTHVRRTGDIGLFKVVSEGPLAAGVRRMEAVAGRVALAHVQQMERELRKAAATLKTSPAEVAERVEKLTNDYKALVKAREADQSKAAAAGAGALVQNARKVRGVNVVVHRQDDLDAKGLRELADKVRDKLQSGVVALGSNKDEKAALLVAVTKDLTDKINAGKLVAAMAEVVGGRGGGKADMAQAGGPNKDKLDEALSRVDSLLP
ncbi:MAG: alanine--tRNA ligase [Myxococcota bacterium]